MKIVDTYLEFRQKCEIKTYETMINKSRPRIYKIIEVLKISAITRMMTRKDPLSNVSSFHYSGFIWITFFNYLWFDRIKRSCV